VKELSPAADGRLSTTQEDPWSVRYLLLIVAAAVAIPLAAAEADWRSPDQTEVPGIELRRDAPPVRAKAKPSAKPKAKRKAIRVQTPRRRAARPRPVRVRTRARPPERTWSPPKTTRTPPRREGGARAVTPRPAPAGDDDEAEVGDGDD
jgi:hypothetical protein